MPIASIWMPGLQAALDQDIVCRGSVEVIDQQVSGRVLRPGRGEHGFDCLNAAHLPAKPGDAVIIPVENRHDHGLVDNVPQVDQPAEVGHFTADTPGLGPQNFSSVHRKQPIRGQGVPAERVAFHRQVVFAAPLGGPFQRLGARLPALWFEPGPIERQRGRIEKRQQLFGTLLSQLLLLPGIFAIGQRDQVKGCRAEEEPVLGLRYGHLPVGQRCLVGLQDGEGGVHPPPVAVFVIHAFLPKKVGKSLMNPCLYFSANP